jgi:4-diphosphocytidyl-2-C-methyl-D-erythritol kinase
MQAMTVQVPAKINLSLDVTGRRPDGYHLLSTIMQSISLFDQVYVEIDRQGKGIILLCDRPGIPLDERNTCHRAASLFLDAARIEAGVRIFLQKQIPEAAGLAGGSSDAAGVLYALSELFGHPLKPVQLQALAVQVGADVPFCLRGGTILCEGIGEVLTPLPAFADQLVILVKPGFGLATPWVFKQLDLAHLAPRPRQKEVCDALAHLDLAALAQATANVLESVSIKAHPLLAEIKQALLAAGASLAMMSGSGPTIFGLFASEDLQKSALARLPDLLPAGCQIYAARTLAQGPRTAT